MQGSVREGREKVAGSIPSISTDTDGQLKGLRQASGELLSEQSDNFESVAQSWSIFMPFRRAQVLSPVKMKW